MIFQHTWQWIIDKSPHTGKPKRQTRRIVGIGEYAEYDDAGNIIAIYNANGRRKWYLGQKVSIQPGRNKKSVGTIRVTCLGRQDVRDIEEQDTEGEGFNDYFKFIQLWALMHDPDGTPLHMEDIDNYHARLLRRHKSLYDGWVLEFELYGAAKSGTMKALTP